MLKDEVRTRTYELAIKQNTHIFKDKVSSVLTQLPTVFCQAARHVFVC